LAKARNSGTVLAGTFGLTSMRGYERMRPATGAMSRMKLKLSFSYIVALVAADGENISSV